MRWHSLSGRVSQRTHRLRFILIFLSTLHVTWSISQYKQKIFLFRFFDTYRSYCDKFCWNMWLATKLFGNICCTKSRRNAAWQVVYSTIAAENGAIYPRMTESAAENWILTLTLSTNLTLTLTLSLILTLTYRTDPRCSVANKCIGHDTKAAARQSLNCIKNKKKIKYGEKRFSIWRMEFLHPAVWHVALESWQWIHQVAAPCNVIRGSRMTCH